MDGALGTGASLGVSSLSLGTHVITASSTDGGSLTGTDTISVTIEAANTAPVVSITAPADGSTHVQGSTVTFTGTSMDAQEGDLGAGIAWSSDMDGALGTGASLGVSSLSLGTHVITASSTDGGSLTGTDTISLTIVVTNTDPEVTITAPDDDSDHMRGSVVTFTGTSVDAEEGDLSAGIAWSSDVDGALGTGATLHVSTLSVGAHRITASSTDSAGGTGSDSIMIMITPVLNSRPVVRIDEPLDDDSFAPGQLVLFTGSAAERDEGHDDDDDDDDPESDTPDPSLTAALRWTSNRDGVIGYGGSFQASLTRGYHWITAAVAGDNELADAASVLVRVGVQGFDVLPAPVLRLESTSGVNGEWRVRSWSDLSGNGNDLYANGNPRLVNGLTPSGIQAIELDGNWDFLGRTARHSSLQGLPAGNQDRTVLTLARFVDTDFSGGVSYGSSRTNQGFGLEVKRQGGRLTLRGYGSNNEMCSDSQVLGAGWCIVGAVLDQGTLTLLQDGAVVLSRNHTFDTRVRELYVGQNLYHWGAVEMDVAAVLIFDRALTQQELADVTSYLSEKYLAPARNQ